MSGFRQRFVASRWGCLAPLSCVALVVGACGAPSPLADAGRGIDAGTVTPDGGSLGRNPACPLLAPGNQSDCGPILTQCEYGDAVPLACDLIAVCDNDNSWGLSVSDCSSASDAGDGCPIAAVAGQPCPQRGVLCAYATDIRECPISARYDQLWRPFPEPNCPFPRPRIGDLCATQNQFCDYSTCGASVICDKGIWLPSIGDCSP